MVALSAKSSKSVWKPPLLAAQAYMLHPLKLWHNSV